MAEDIWGRLFILVGLACMIWSQFARDPAWIAGAACIILGLLVIPAPKERSDG